MSWMLGGGGGRGGPPSMRGHGCPTHGWGGDVKVFCPLTQNISNQGINLLNYNLHEL